MRAHATFVGRRAAAEHLGRAGVAVGVELTGQPRPSGDELARIGTVELVERSLESCIGSVGSHRPSVGRLPRRHPERSARSAPEFGAHRADLRSCSARLRHTADARMMRCGGRAWGPHGNDRPPAAARASGSGSGRSRRGRCWSRAASRRRSRPTTASPTCRPTLLEAIASALTGVEVDYRDLEPLGPEELADVLAGRDRAVPPADRAPHGARRARAAADPDRRRAPGRAVRRGARRRRTTSCGSPRRYAQGAYGLAWMDLQRSGFVEHVREAEPGDAAPSSSCRADAVRARRSSTPSSRRAGRRSPTFPPGPLGRAVWEMYDGRGFALPGTPGGAPRVPRAARLRARARRLRHQPQGRARGVRVHRAGRPRPEGLRVAGDADRPVRDRLHRDTGLLRPRRPRAQHPGAGHAPPRRRRDPAGQGRVRALRRRPVRRRLPRARRSRPVDEVRELLRIPPKSAAALRRAARPASFDLDGMSEIAAARTPSSRTRARP